jgi:hypothetical protein
LQQVRVDEFGNIDKNDCVRHNIGHVMDGSRYLDVLTDGANFIKNNGYYAKDILGKDTGLIS